MKDKIMLDISFQLFLTQHGAYPDRDMLCYPRLWKKQDNNNKNSVELEATLVPAEAEVVYMFLPWFET